MKRGSYEDITLAGATSRDFSAKKMARPLGRDNFLQKHPEMSPSQCYILVTNEFHIL
jgi:hypothetical protein